MKIKFLKTLAICTLALSVPSSAFCVLGESEAQIAKRFTGADPIDQKTEKGYITKIYQVPPYQISVDFWKGKSAGETYQKLDGSGISDKEIADLLAANSAGQTWELNNIEGASKDITSWSRLDYKASAGYEIASRKLSIIDSNFGDLLRKQPL